MQERPLAVLIGPPGAGKSGVGRKLAKYLAAPFVDTDARIAQAHGPIPEIFRTRGEQHFRQLEREVVAEALTEAAVVSLGGGAVLDEGTQSQLGDQRVVLLTVSPSAVARRLAGSKRPLLATESADDRLAAWSALVDSRRDIYERLAVASWDTSTRPITAIAGEIARWVTEQEEERARL